VQTPPVPQPAAQQLPRHAPLRQSPPCVHGVPGAAPPLEPPEALALPVVPVVPGLRPVVEPPLVPPPVVAPPTVPPLLPAELVPCPPAVDPAPDDTPPEPAAGRQTPASQNQPAPHGCAAVHRSPV